LDHRVLLPTHSDKIRLEEMGRQVRARFEDREWVFPREDCVLLPIANTTAELLARWIAERLTDAFSTEKGFRPKRVKIEVEESFGQLATYEAKV
jgi:6-pyruvoyltetrahydropterin/6-carboxytetrahydropterin synthase